MSLVLRGMGQGSQGQLVQFGMMREPTGGGPPDVPPFPYGDDNVDRLYRDDITQWARRQERVEKR